MNLIDGGVVLVGNYHAHGVASLGILRMILDRSESYRDVIVVVGAIVGLVLENVKKVTNV